MHIPEKKTFLKCFKASCFFFFLISNWAFKPKRTQFNNGEGKKEKDAKCTRCSQAVTHPGTDRARRCLTSVIGREPVHSTWYGPWRRLLATWGTMSRIATMLRKRVLHRSVRFLSYVEQFFRSYAVKKRAILKLRETFVKENAYSREKNIFEMFQSELFFFFLISNWAYKPKRTQFNNGEGKKEKDAKCTRCSQAVTHLGTDLARRCLTSVIGREPVHSTWYGPWRRLLATWGTMSRVATMLRKRVLHRSVRFLSYVEQFFRSYAVKKRAILKLRETFVKENAYSREKNIFEMFQSELFFFFKFQTGHLSQNEPNSTMAKEKKKRMPSAPGVPRRSPI